jgi:hypothetical protein
VLLFLFIGKENKMDKEEPKNAQHPFLLNNDNRNLFTLNVFHKINMEKVQTIEDIKLILEHLDITVQEGTTAYEKLKHLL